MTRGHNRKSRRSPTNFQLEALFLNSELGELGTLHEFDDLLDLFEVQIIPWLCVEWLDGLVRILGLSFKSIRAALATIEFENIPKPTEKTLKLGFSH